MNTAWLVYAASALVLNLMFARIVLKRYSNSVAIILLAILLTVLLTPVSVPDTQQMAPAWLAACFEYLFGQPELAYRALRPLVFSMLVCLIVISLSVAFRSFFKQRASIRR